MMLTNHLVHRYTSLESHFTKRFLPTGPDYSSYAISGNDQGLQATWSALLLEIVLLAVGRVVPRIAQK